jgi:uncharacterized protein
MFDPRFMDGETWGEPGEPVTHIETHAAHVFLCGSHAYKMKKAVKLPYLDFSSLQQRRAVLARELEVNKRFAPGLYLGLIEVEGESVLKMRRFPASAMLAEHIGQGHLSDALAQELAKTVAAAHAVAPEAQASGIAIMSGLGAQLSKAFADSPDVFPPEEAQAFQSRYREVLESLAPLLGRRSAQGLVRRCHGDLHCGNIIVLAGSPVLFDAIEFSETIASIDVLYDLAFLIMDLIHRGERRAANIVMNRYVHLRRDAEDLSGLEAMPLFLATRAGVRALVSADLAHELPDEEADAPRRAALGYFRESLAYLKHDAPRLICIGGISGTGKTTIAASLALEIGAPPGALHIRSDVERKVLAGIAETEHLPPSYYTPQKSHAVYEAVFARACRALQAKHSVIVDAVFNHESERRAVADLARRQGAAFCGSGSRPIRRR